MSSDQSVAENPTGALDKRKGLLTVLYVTEIETKMLIYCIG